MHAAGFELPRIPLLRRWVNRSVVAHGRDHSAWLRRLSARLSSARPPGLTASLLQRTTRLFTQVPRRSVLRPSRVRSSRVLLEDAWTIARVYSTIGRHGLDSNLVPHLTGSP